MIADLFWGKWFLVGKGGFPKDEEAGGRHIEDLFWRAVFGRCGLVAGWLRKDHSWMIRRQEGFRNIFFPEIKL